MDGHVKHSSDSVSIKTPNLQTTLTTNDLICSRFHTPMSFPFSLYPSNTGVCSTSQQGTTQYFQRAQQKASPFLQCDVSLLNTSQCSIISIDLHLFHSYVLWASRYQMLSESTILVLNNVRALKKLCCVCFMCVWAQKPCMYVCLSVCLSVNTRDLQYMPFLLLGYQCFYPR